MAAGHTPPVAGAATGLFAITPSLTVPLPYVTQSIYVTGAGNVRLCAAGDDIFVDFIAVPARTVLPIAAAFVSASGTTATGLIGFHNGATVRVPTSTPMQLSISATATAGITSRMRGTTAVAAAGGVSAAATVI